MSQIRTAKAGDHGAFPGSVFVIDDTPPIAQCQETQITGVAGITIAGQPTLTEVGAFTGINLAGKQLNVAVPPPNAGNKTILSNTDDTVTIIGSFAVSDAANSYTARDAGTAYLTRNESSFSRFIENQSKAHTTKGGQLFTDLADPPMDDACSDTFNPA